MTSEQAKEILRAYRPGSDDAEDSEVAQALEFAKNDADLNTWLHKQAVFHDDVRTRLREIPVPPGLKEAIMARGTIIVAPFWRRPEFLLAAACVAFALVLGGMFATRVQEDKTFAGFRSRMVGFALRLYSMDVQTKDDAEVRAFMRARGAPADYALTPALKTTPLKGGARLSWQGHPVAMVCFDLSTNQTLYMFVMDRTAVSKGKPPGSALAMAEVGGIWTASWSRGNKVYLVAADTSREELQRLVEASRAGEVRVKRGGPLAGVASERVPLLIVGSFVRAGTAEQPKEIGPFIFTEGEG